MFAGVTCATNTSGCIIAMRASSFLRSTLPGITFPAGAILAAASKGVALEAWPPVLE